MCYLENENKTNVDEVENIQNDDSQTLIKLGILELIHSDYVPMNHI